MKNAYMLALLVAGAGLASAQDIDDDLFPRPDSLEPAIEFWERVYTEVDTQSGFIHDSLHLGVVYETVELGDTRGSRQRRSKIDTARNRYRDILNRLGSGRRGDLSAEEKRVLALWPDGVSDAELSAAAGRLRFQLGQSDRFLAGLKRSGTYRDYIERALREKDLPSELGVLPHVESSFDPTAYSRVGAAGMWQFTRSTGLRYMRIDHIVDERRDPFLSAHAAAQLLKDNHAVLESWPLALTAYNHGQSGMRRAAQQQGTKDIGVIIENYKGRYFGFASRNFYPAFVAALEIDSDPERYFGRVALDPPSDTAVIEVPDYVSAESLARALDVPLNRLRALNPALMDTVWEGDKFVPKGFSLRLPSAVAAESASRLAALPATERYAAQRPDLEHRVRRGDTLSQIADRYGLGLSSLLRANNLRSRDLIRVGQVLTLPVTGQPAPRTLAQQSGGAGGEYVVRRGDTLHGIAARHGVDVSTLVAANGLANEDRIIAGQVLRVAAGEPAPEASPALAEAEPGSEPARAAPDAVLASVDASAAASLAENAQAVDSAAGPDEGSFASAAATSVSEPPAASEMPAAPGPSDPAAASEPPAAPDSLAAREPSAPPGATEDPEADTADPSGVATRQARLTADPSDYSVADDGSIEVHSLETLGHYADWLGIRTQRLRDLNGFRFGRAVAIGERIELDFSNVDRDAFEQRRLAYQESIQETFFSSYRIADVTDHVVSTGESLWLLAQRTYDVPLWLLRQYNPDLDLHRVRPGTVVKFPELTQIAEERSAVPTEDELG